MEEKYLHELRAVLETGWSEETIPPAYKWDPEKKSSGQCYVTARAVHEILGGELLHSVSEHQFWNRLDGTEVDFTSDQSEGGDGIHPVDGFSGKPRKFKPIEECKSLNPRLKWYLDVVEGPLLKFREKYAAVLKE